MFVYVLKDKYNQYVYFNFELSEYDTTSCFDCAFFTHSLSLMRLVRDYLIVRCGYDNLRIYKVCLKEVG